MLWWTGVDGMDGAGSADASELPLPPVKEKAKHDRKIRAMRWML